MEMNKMLNNEIANDIMQSVSAQFNLTIDKFTEIQRGWLNLKWKIETNHGYFLVKQYHKERFKKYQPESLHYALQQQNLLHKSGIPCSRILTRKGEFFQFSNEGEQFIVMDFCDGKILKPETLLEEHMYDLGKATGLMHNQLNTTTSIKHSPQFKIPTIEERLKHWDIILIACQKNGKHHLLPIIENQISATKRINLDDFLSCPTGWSHRDLWTDNLLFNESSLSAILDFDRLNYDYLDLDVARAIASCTLQNGEFNRLLVKAFIKGYRQNREFSSGMLKRSLELLWFMESAWWINENMDELNSSALRFAEEMKWLATMIIYDNFPSET
ncbi:phosphotransferase [Heyndrickxia sporothermodurans]